MRSRKRELLFSRPGGRPRNWRSPFEGEGMRAVWERMWCDLPSPPEARPGARLLRRLPRVDRGHENAGHRAGGSCSFPVIYRKRSQPGPEMRAKEGAAPVIFLLFTGNRLADRSQAWPARSAALGRPEVPELGSDHALVVDRTLQQASGTGEAIEAGDCVLRDRRLIVGQIARNHVRDQSGFGGRKQGPATLVARATSALSARCACTTARVPAATMSGSRLIAASLVTRTGMV